MKPTQQEIIELAREAGIVFDERAMPYYERLVHLALERFGAGGAGGGEPVMVVEVEGGCWDTTDFVNFFGIPDGTYSLYTRPSPTDLQSVRDRALDDAAAICRTYDCSPRMAAAEIEALKGKQ